MLAQQIVAEVAAQEWSEDALFALCRRAWPYRELPREDFAAIVRMLAEGFSTRRGRRGALIHHDAVNGMLRGRRGARLTALTSGGTIPDNADYQVVLEPENQVVGTVNEDFAVESLAGDVFQLGNTSYRIRGSSAARCASRMRRASRRTSRSGSAKRRAAATSCRRRCRGCARRIAARLEPRAGRDAVTARAG